MGTPKRCAEPTTMSAPHSPGGVSFVRANKSVATQTLALAACASSTVARWPPLGTVPSVPGYWTRTPQTSPPDFRPAEAKSASLATTTLRPRPSARVLQTSIVCGWQASDTKNVVFLPRARAEHMVIASAAAVASSSRLAFEICMPVRSVTAVWKVSSASRRPCAISAW